ncbi:hypothetical protein EBZ39_03985 [bacterium]|nr:hypothetical protein [bacterium]
MTLKDTLVHVERDVLVFDKPFRHIKVIKFDTQDINNNEITNEILEITYNADRTRFHVPNTEFVFIETLNGLSFNRSFRLVPDVPKVPEVAQVAHAFKELQLKNENIRAYVYRK